MINIQELRVGNIVNRQFWNPHPETPSYMYSAVRVNAIGESLCNVSPMSRNEKWRLPYDILFPIPLTEQILLDSGFKLSSTNIQSNEYRIECEDGYFYVGIGSHEPIFARGWQVGKIKMIPCHETQYVHNLQNAYRLVTGEELNIIIK